MPNTPSTVISSAVGPGYVPDTAALRAQLARLVRTRIREQANTIIDVPTSVGKTHTVATNDWSDLTGLTNNRPVIHLHPTHDARDDAIEASFKAGLRVGWLRGREEHSAIVNGAYDHLSIEGRPLSEWIEDRCRRDGFRFHDALQDAERRIAGTPPWKVDDDSALSQWDGLVPLDRSRYEIVHATHQFAFAPPLRDGTVIVFDEQPSFTKDLNDQSEGLTRDRVRSAVTAFLNEVDAPVSDYEQLITESTQGNPPRDGLRAAAARKPNVDWYLNDPDAHILGPVFTEAIIGLESRSNHRYVGTTSRASPILFGSAENLANTVKCTLVLDEHNTIRTLRVLPDLSTAHVVLGLDAYPTLPLWRLNTGVDMDRQPLLSVGSQRRWRLVERGLTVIQVGEDTRYHTRGNLNARELRAVVRELRERYDDFRSAICAEAVEADVRQIMEQAGIPDPILLHYGEQHSLNTLQDEEIGLVIGCIDPGDDFVLDALAELDLDATPEWADEECRVCRGDGCIQCLFTGNRRAPGRGFTGPDRRAAASILASVRDHNVAQAIGRYARDPGNPNSGATVYVLTNVFPQARLRDGVVPGVVWELGEKQRTIVAHAREQDETTASEIAAHTPASKRHVRETLDCLVDHGYATRERGAGPYGADLFRVNSGAPTDDYVDVDTDTRG